ncbi:MAG: 50S ribosomal protein L32 [Armatimonadetes bacterium]|nr:50S ribosomal protein L32 [Armatimonadota bacterium]
MGIQKHRRSRKSGANRRAHWKARLVALVECPKCHAQMRSHRVCANCGYYAGREVIKIEEEEPKKR